MMRFLLVFLMALPAMAQLGPHSFTNGNIVWVDAATGNDTTAMKYRSDRPFRTLTAAKNASVGPDLIAVRPGTYLGTNLLKVGVNYWFGDGAIVTNNPAAATLLNHDMFSDKLIGPTTNIIDGFGEFRTLFETNQSSVAAQGVLAVTNAASTVIFRGRKVLVRSFVNNTVSALDVRDCRHVSFEVDEVRDADVDRQSFDPLDPEAEIYSSAIGVYWERGDAHISINRNSMEAGYCAWANEPLAGATNELFYRGNYAKSSKGNCFYLSGATDSYKWWIENLEADAPEGNVLSSISGGGKLYFTGQKMRAATPVSNLGVKMWVNAQKITSVGTSFLLTANAGQTWMTAMEYETEAPLSAPGFDIGGGTNYLFGGYARVTNAIGLRVSGLQKTRVVGMTIETVNSVGTGDTNEPALAMTNGLTFQNSALIAPNSSVKSLKATNLNNHVNIEGSLWVSTSTNSTCTITNGTYKEGGAAFLSVASAGSGSGIATNSGTGFGLTLITETNRPALTNMLVGFMPQNGDEVLTDLFWLTNNPAAAIYPPYGVGYVQYPNNSGVVSNINRFEGINPWRTVSGKASLGWHTEYWYNPNASTTNFEHYLSGYNIAGTVLDRRLIGFTFNHHTGGHSSSMTVPVNFSQIDTATNVFTLNPNYQHSMVGNIFNFEGGGAAAGEMRFNKRSSANFRTSADGSGYSVLMNANDSTFWIVNNNATTTGVLIDSALATSPTSVTLTADNQSVNCTNRSYIKLSSDNATAGNRTFVLTANVAAMTGQIITIEWVGTNAGEIADDGALTGGGNVRLSAIWTPTQYDTLTLRFNGTDLVEMSRSTN